MPCPANLDYPDYLKSIFKQIQLENNNNLKACACSIKTIPDEEGCLITDEDNKIVAFPFCWQVGAPPVTSTQLPRLTAKQAMKLYWKSNSITPINLTYYSNAFGGCPPNTQFTLTPNGNQKLEKRKFSTNELTPNSQRKEFVCPHYVSFVQDFIWENCDGVTSDVTYEVIKFFAGDNYVNKEDGIYYFYPSVYTNIGFYTSILTTEGCPHPCSPDEGTPVKIQIGVDSELIITQFDFDDFDTPDSFSFNNTTITINES